MRWLPEDQIAWRYLYFPRDPSDRRRGLEPRIRHSEGGLEIPHSCILIFTLKSASMLRIFRRDRNSPRATVIGAGAKRLEVKRKRLHCARHRRRIRKPYSQTTMGIEFTPTARVVGWGLGWGGAGLCFRVWGVKPTFLPRRPLMKTHAESWTWRHRAMGNIVYANHRFLWTKNALLPSDYIRHFSISAGRGIRRDRNTRA